MRRLLAAAAVLGLTACITDSVGIAGTKVTGGGDPVDANSVAGVYTIRTMGGQPLPYTISQTGTDKVEMINDVITLTDANTYTEVITERETVSGTATTNVTTDNGTFVRASSGSITFNSTKVIPFTGTLVNGTLTLFWNAQNGTVPQTFTK